MSKPKARDLAFRAARAIPEYPIRRTGLAAAAVGVGALTSLPVWPDTQPLIYLAGTGGMASMFAWWAGRHVMKPGSTKSVMIRASRHSQRTKGVASRLDIAQYASPAAFRMKARQLRPTTFGGADAKTIRKADATEFGVELAELGLGWWGEKVWSSVEDTTLRIGGPRVGKTLSLAPHGVDAKGALVTTSTRIDLAEQVHQARSVRTIDGQEVEGVVHFFNPSGYVDVDSTVRWSILSGCGDFTVARRRAADLIPEAPDRDGERWDRQARRVLALFLHAAAKGGKRATDVLRWAGDTDPGGVARTEVIDALNDGTAGGHTRAAEARAHWETNVRTMTSITNTMMPALSWLSDDRARDLGDADPETTTLDIVRLIQECETLHLLGHEDQSGLAPLIAAVVAEIAHQARRLAGQRPGGRLDPPLTLLLDEAALVCPVPLDKWTADMGGRGVTIHVSAQSLSQLRQRWGADGAGTILGNIGTLLVFGGNKSAEDLQELSILTGDHRQEVLGETDDSTDHRWAPVLSPAQISAMPPQQALLLPRGMMSVVGWPPLIINRKGWKQVPLVATKKPSAEEVEAVKEELAQAEEENREPEADGR